MHEITKPGPGTDILIVVPTPCLPEVSDGGKLDVHFPAVVVAAVHSLQRIGRILLVEEFDVDMSDDVISQIVTDMQFVDPSVLSKLQEHVLVKIEEVVEALLFVDGGVAVPGSLDLCQLRRVAIKMLDQ